MIDITEIVMGLIGILMALLTSVLIPYLKSKTNADQYNQIQIWASAAVKAAEQKYTGSGKGKEKKEYVLNYLKDKNIQVDEKTIETLIESSVLELKHAISD